MKPLQADVIVIGGGLMGTAAAFFLRRRGRSVILLERGLVGQQASGVNFGNVRRQGRFLPQLPLANRSREIWGRLRELLGEDAEFLATGHIRVCYDPSQIGVIEAYAQKARDYGLDLELLSANALKARFGFFGPEAIAGSYSPNDGHANPRLAAPAFARAAARAGVEVFENTEIVSIAKPGDDFQATAADGSVFSAPIALVTAGAWGGALSQQFEEPVPLAVHGPQMAVTEPLPYRIRPVIGVSTVIPAEVVYLRQVERGNVVFGGGARGPAFADTRRAYAVPGNLTGQVRQIRRLVPALANMRVIRTWSGIESYLPDDIPIMGPSARLSGLYYAFGFCGHGFQLGPGVGDVMAELIDRGSTTTLIEPFHIKRFATAEAARLVSA
ncbi:MULTISPECIES: FAD-binding oxidoreductase [unclassified Mesorhizobium]|uniref:NAD(P)/FAD-dependent oxidoreductase n=1 Tax=unclassified Mesorhizobium TaxID=325217 RepID=UPI000FD79B59|nr:MULTISPECIES: FAD-binding oxidoreductase [unclassified Mesorhizobium]TGQ31037.1 FAD-binding oxidoreductase [Mesorhizobium sp. M00.F.Ca.ET.216.01.1.1]TIS86742.1 MAG: FAD-dependent oxidoreductase [Mesorhizobium sp.]TJW06350.1 MAG: FAD-dependent oxidoreductase [Mesorhizobium sp.]TJW45883.1 MAG: FAD-dependent oxidoreductase [Mesorhizobium sp.]